MKKQIRCAIYTRKSTEEGLEQDFNSLDAQREACESYIKSQTHEGWVLIKKQYNDGGYLGGTMERPAFKELLEDIKNNKIDIVVVYKVDRLTHSLMDFSKIIEIFDQHNASFVSITQHFNTTTSMGRLTLNILLSFAQFEREVTGERIRDKFEASRKKGLWLTGAAPYGDEKGEHTYELTRETSATCLSAGSLTYTCKVCDDTYSEEAPSLGHIFAPATCTSPSICTVCSATEGEALPHTLTWATCTVPATCTVCGTTVGSTISHSYTEATCTAPTTCTVCGTTTGDVIPHVYTDATCTAAAICTVCGNVDGTPLAHDFAPATTKSPKTCRVCGTTEGEAITLHVIVDPEKGTLPADNFKMTDGNYLSPENVPQFNFKSPYSNPDYSISWDLANEVMPKIYRPPTYKLMP